LKIFEFIFVAGNTFLEYKADYKTAPIHSWTKIEGKLFQVRIGPNYSTYKKKAPSVSPLYESFAVDIFW
jgi:hypothetical protein